MKRGQRISQKCLKCSEVVFRGTTERPDCYKGQSCHKKRCYYRRLDYYREQMRNKHRYHKYCGDKCAMCGSKDNLEVHHVNNQSVGGRDLRMNIMTLCYPCHMFITRYIKMVSVYKA